MFETQGIIIYEPRRRMKEGTKWWLTVELPSFYETMDYYRWFIDREWYNSDSHSLKRKYSRPSHPPHISINRGEIPRKNIGDWGKFMSKKRVTVRYSNLITQVVGHKKGKDNFWIIPNVEVLEYVPLRKHFGLDYKRNGKLFTGHITIARAF